MADHSSTRAPPKRNSEARREQNRLASRNYRQPLSSPVRAVAVIQLLTPAIIYRAEKEAEVGSARPALNPRGWRDH